MVVEEDLQVILLLVGLVHQVVVEVVLVQQLVVLVIELYQVIRTSLHHYNHKEIQVELVDLLIILEDLVAAGVPAVLVEMLTLQEIQETVEMVYQHLMEMMVFQPIMEHLAHHRVDGLLVVVLVVVIPPLLSILNLEVLVAVDPV
tara:strand:- start:154 stop:588 length:435 start_codon:yes stop_codon:yes gene_type:complete